MGTLVIYADSDSFAQSVGTAYTDARNAGALAGAIATNRVYVGQAYINTGSTANLNGIATTAGTYVAVGAGGTIRYSTDGIAWSSASSGTTNDLNGVCFGASTTFVAVGAGGTITTSTSGTAFTTETSGTAADLYGVSGRGAAFFAVGAGGAILTSQSAGVWTRRTSNTANNLYGAASNGDVMVAVGAGGTIRYSTNFSTWSTATVATSATFYAVSYANSRFVAVGDGVIASSGNGTTWTLQTSPSVVFRGVAQSGTAVHLVGDSGNVYYTADRDAVDARAQTSNTTSKLGAVCWSSTNEMLVAVGAGGIERMSPDGMAWSSTYLVTQASVSFPTASAIASAGAITATSASLDLALASDRSTTDFYIQAWTPNRYPSGGTADFVAGTALSSLTALGSATTSGIGAGYTTIASGATIAALATAAPTISFMLSSSRQASGGTPTGAEYVELYSSDQTGTTNDPKLTITYSDRIGLFVGGSEYTSATSLSSIAVTDSGPNSVGRLNATYEQPSGVFGVPPLAPIALKSGVTSLWQGRSISRDVEPTALGYRVLIDAVDLSGDLDRAVVTSYSSGTAAKSDKTVVQELVTTYGTATSLTAPDATVVASGALLTSFTAEGQTLRAALDSVVDEVVTNSTFDFTQQAVANFYQSDVVLYGNGWFVAPGSTGSGERVFYSSNGVSWSSFSRPGYPGGGVFANGIFVFASGNGVAVGTAPTTLASYTSNISTSAYRAVAYGSAGYVAVGNAGTAYVSADAISWTGYAQGAGGAQMSDVAYGTNYVAVGNFGTAMVSASGTAWTAYALPLYYATGITYGTGVYVAVGSTGAYAGYAYSTSGTAWTAGTVTACPAFQGVRYVNGWFLALGDGGAIYGSQNGSSWSRASSPSTGSIYDVAYGSEAWVTVGRPWTGDAAGAILRSATNPATTSYFVDQDGRVNYNVSAGTAPYAISDTPNGTTLIAASELSLDYDDSQVINAVYVASAPSDWIYATWVTDAQSIAAYGRREAFLADADAVDSATATPIGNAYLASRSAPLARGSFTVTGKDGWRAGQTVTITSSALGLSGSTFQITQVDTSFLTGTGTRAYRVSFGALPKSLVRLLAAT